MTQYTIPAVVLDSCSIWGNYSRDWVLTLAFLGHIDIFWCERILTALDRHLLPRRIQKRQQTILARDGSLTPEEALSRASAEITPSHDRTLSLMRSMFPEAMVGDGELQNHLHKCTNDPEDRHVLACAMAKNCKLIVTENIKDFPTKALEPYGIKAMRLDSFLATLPQPILFEAIHTIAKRSKRPPDTPATVIETMEILGLRQACAKTNSEDEARQYLCSLLSAYAAR